MNAQLFEKAFYQKTDTEKVDTKAASAPAPAAAKQGDAADNDRQLLERLMSDESTAELLLALVKKLT